MLVLRGAACLMFTMSPLSPRWSQLCCQAPCFTLAGCCLAPDGLNSRAPMLACPPYRGETSATIRGLGFRHASPSPDVLGVMGRIWPHPPSRAITRRRTQCQSRGRDLLSFEERAPQLTHTDPSRTVYPLQPGAPAEPERSRTASRRGSEPDTAGQAAEQGNTGRPAGTSDGSATNNGPPRTHHRTGQP